MRLIDSLIISFKSLNDNSTIPAYSVNITSKTVIYMIPHGKSINSSQSFKPYEGNTCDFNVDNKTITFTSQTSGR